MNEQLIPSGHPPSAKIEPAWWFIFAAHKMMVLEEYASVSIPLIIGAESLGLSPLRERYLGTLAGRDCYCAEVSEDGPFPPQTVFTDCGICTGAFPIRCLPSP